MSGVFTLRSLWFLEHGNGAPIWRTIVSLGNSMLVNLVAAVVVAWSVGYVVRRVALYRFAHLVERESPEHRHFTAIFPLLAAIALFVSPPFFGQIYQLTPFIFALVFPAVSLALLASLIFTEEDALSKAESQAGEEGEPVEDPRRGVAIRLLLSGALAAAGAYESSLGLAFALVAPFITLWWVIRLENPIWRVTGVWLVGFAAVGAAELYWLPGCSLHALKPILPPLGWLLAFVILGIVPISVLLRLGPNRRVFVIWGLALAGCALWDARKFTKAKPSASEVFARRSLAQLGGRQLVLADGVFDDVFRCLAPAGVRVVGTRTVEDREFLVNFFTNDEPVTNKALVVRQCYALPEFAAAAKEAGLVMRERKMAAKAPTAEQRKAAEEQVLRPVVESLETMQKRFASIPAEARAAEMEQARKTLRESLDKGARGLQISSMLLALDMMAKDPRALESDALTALIIDRGDPSANAALGSLRLAAGRLDDAERYLKVAARAEGMIAMRDYARVLVGRGQFEEAEKWARKAVAKGKSDWTAREPLVAALIELGKFEEAERELNALMAQAASIHAEPQARAFVTAVRRRLTERRGK